MKVVRLTMAQALACDLAIVVAGGFPGKAMKNWREKSPHGFAHSFDCEFGFSVWVMKSPPIGASRRQIHCEH